MTALFKPMTIAQQAMAALDRSDSSGRIARYRQNWQYYLNQQYNEAADVKAAGLYDRIKPVFNCVTKIVDVDARFAMGEHLAVDTTNKRSRAAIEKLWEDSNFQQAKYLMVRYGACCGDVYLKVHDNRPWARNPNPDPTIPVQLLVLSPDVVEPYYDPINRDRLVAIDVQFAAGPRVYREVWTEESVTFYRADQPNEVEATYPNPNGFIPFVHVRNLDIGDVFGLSSFHNLIPMLDVLNEIASMTAQSVKVYGDPVIVGKNMLAADLTKRTVDEAGKPAARMWWTPPGLDAEFYLLEWKGENIAAITEFITMVKQAIEEYTPELQLTRVAQHAPSSGFEVDLLLKELKVKVSEMRSNYFVALKKADGMALRMLGRGAKQKFDEEHEIVADPVLAVDDERQLQILRDEIELGIKSRRTAAAQRLRGNVDEELAQVEVERQQDLAEKMKLAQAGNRDTQGQSGALGADKP